MRGIVSKLALCAIPLTFVVLGLGLGSQEYHWDTLERAVILENPSGFWRSWDGSPRSQFLSFAHILELPLATVVRAILGSPSGVRSLVIFELFCAAFALLLVGTLVRQRHGLGVTAVAAQVTLACSWGFWKMGTSGEERIFGMATLLLVLWTYWTLLQVGRRAVLVAATLCIAILAHLSNAVLVPFALLGLLVLPAAQRQQRRRAAAAVTLGAMLSATIYAVVAAVTTDVRTLPQFWHYLTFFHRDPSEQFFAVKLSSATWDQSLQGLAHFFAASTWVGRIALVILVCVPLWFAWRQRWRRFAMQDRHLSLLVVLWTLHFAFYEPSNIKSWSAVGLALVLGAAWSLRTRRLATVLGMLAVLLLVANVPSWQRLHQPMELQSYLEQGFPSNAMAAMNRPSRLVAASPTLQPNS
jgi:hypothetical protein